MTSTAVQLNTRMDANLKRGGEAVLARAGMTASEAIRGLWTYLVTKQEVPACVKQAEKTQEELDWERAWARAKEGEGLAYKIMAAELGCSVEELMARDPYRGLSDQERYEREMNDMYDDMVREMEEQCR